MTAHASGRVQQAGYRTRVIEMVGAFGLRGFVQNLQDGQEKIVAEGEGLIWTCSLLSLIGSDGSQPRA